MTSLKEALSKLNDNLNILREREAKYGGNSPLELLNQIKDHQTAIALTEQAIAGDLTEANWREALKPLLVDIYRRSEASELCQVTIGDVAGNIIGSIIAGGDVTNAQIASGSYIAQATHGGTATVTVENIGQKIVNFITGGPDQQRALRNRQLMLEKVRQFWVEGVLENSLYNTILIELDMEEKPEAVEYPWEKVLQRSNQSNRQLPSDTKIIDVFDQAGQSLLILGEPGSGRTTMLLELARHTLARAQADFTQPMPVVFNLSSWGEKRLPLIEWLIEEFNTKYNIPRKVALSWLENDELLLLLDGLDEVAQDHQVACVEAINTFRQEHLIPLVVCSRAVDYEALSIKLILQQAILLKPLTKEQINNYLAKVNPELIFFQNAIQFDSDLREFVKSPLMLSITLLVQEEFLLQDLNPSNVLNKGRKNLLDIYVKEMFRRRGTTLPYSQEQSTQWLAWITRGLNQYNQTIFLIEQLQPSWLLHRIWRWVYVVGSRLTSLLILGLLMGVIFAVSGSRLYLLRDADVTGPVGWVTFGTLLGLAGGLIWSILEALRLEGIGKNSSPSSWTLGRNILVIGLSLGLLVWLSFWFISNLSSGLTFGIAWGLILGISLGVRSTHQTISNDIQIVEAVSWSWTKALKALPTGLAGGLLLGLMTGLITQLDERLSPLVATRSALEVFGKPNGVLCLAHP